MATKEKSPSRITTGKVILSYANIFEPFTDPKKPKDKPKYKCMLLIDKKDKETVKKFKDAIEFQRKKMIAEKYAGKPPKKQIEHTFNDGDVEKEEEIYEGKYYINVWSYRKPPLVDRHLNPITDPEDLYSGCFVRACLNCYYYWGDESKGITFGLESIQKVSNGERLGGGGVSAEEAFGDDYEFEDDDEDYVDDDEDYDL